MTTEPGAVTTWRVVWITVVTWVFPGFGHALFSRRVAIAWFAAVFLAFATTSFTIYGIPLGLLAVVGNFVHVVVRLLRHRRRVPPHPLWNVPVALLVATLVVGGALKSGIESFRIPSSSMAPTIVPGEILMVRKFAVGTDRGDVVVFSQPCHGRPYLGRIVAFGGETVEMRCQRLYVNGQRVPSQVVAASEWFTDEIGAAITFRRERETLGGVTHDVYYRLENPAFGTFPVLDEEEPPSCARDGKEALVEQPLGQFVDLPTPPADECAPQRHYVVPAGTVFVLGDHRDNSNDSRFWGPVPTSGIVGGIVGRYLPVDRFGSL